MTPVSRETLAQPASGAGRKYVSGFRRNQGERTRAAILESALKLIAAGNFRPEAKAIAAGAGCDKSAVTHHFGAIELLYRVIARQHATAVMAAARGPDVLEQGDLAWLIMVGRRRETP